MYPLRLEQLHYKQDECGVCITSRHHMNLVVQKIHPGFQICVTEFMNRGCYLSCMAVKQWFCCNSCWWCRCTRLLCKTDCQKLQTVTTFVTVWVKLAYWVSQVCCEKEADRKGQKCEPYKVKSIYHMKIILLGGFIVVDCGLWIYIDVIF